MSQRPTNPIRRIFSLLRVGPVSISLRFYDQFKRRRTGAPVWRLSEITPQLYLGGQHYPHGWAAMQQRGITAVVNLREAHHDDVAKGIGGLRHLHLPTRDNTPPALEDLARGVDFITEEIARGGKVYVHCGVGVGRAPAQVAAFLISQGQTPREALQTIRRVRPFVHLTPGQQRQLAAFAAHTQAAAHDPRIKSTHST